MRGTGQCFAVSGKIAICLVAQPIRFEDRLPSGSRQGALSFCWRLILAPPAALEAVAVHELCHLRVFGHGPRFWELLETRVPDYAVWRRWLKRHGPELHAALD